MCVVHSAGDFRDELCRLPGRDRPATNYFVEPIAFDESHAEVARTLALADFVNWNDPSMIYSRHRFGLPPKALQVRVSCPLTSANHLYRDCATETPLPGPKYYALAATTDFLQQLVIAKISGHLLGRSPFGMR